MAGRPPKEGIDYSGWAVDIFDNDPKIDKLLDAQGAKGFLIYFYLCQRAYGSKGYYYSWGYDDAATTARKIGGGVGSEAVKETVRLCLQIGLFDERLFARDGILTSKGIQKRYWQVAKERTANTVNPDYWLLDETAGSVNSTQNTNYAGSKSNYAAPKLNNAPLKESKGKNKEDLHVFFESVWKLYPLKKGKGKVSDATKRKLMAIGYDALKLCIDRYVADKPDWQNYQHGSSFFNKGYVDYLDENYTQPQEEGPKWKPL